MSTILQSVMVFFIYDSFNTQNIAVKNKFYMFFCTWILHKKKLPLSHTQSRHLVYTSYMPRAMLRINYFLHFKNN
jgi:hypothetical protein